MLNFLLQILNQLYSTNILILCVFAVTMTWLYKIVWHRTKYIIKMSLDKLTNFMQQNSCSYYNDQQRGLEIFNLQKRSSNY